MNNLYYIKNLSDKAKLIDRINNERPPFKVLIEKPGESRTIDQNAYYFGVVCKMIGDDIGETVDEVHEIFANKYRIDYFMDKDGIMRFKRKSTTLDSIQNFWDYVEAICAFCLTELNIYIPSPDECPTNEGKLKLTSL